MRIRILLLAICLMTSTIMLSQTIDHVKPPYPDEVNVGAVDVERDGQTLVIFYSVRFGSKISWCDIALYQSTDGGRTFTNISSSNYLSGDIGRIYEGGEKKISYNISHIKEQLADKQLVFKVEILKQKVLERNFMVLGAASVYPVPSYGLMLAYAKNMGFYLKCRYNFQAPYSGPECTTDGLLKLDDGSYTDLWTTGKERTFRTVLAGGMIFCANNYLYPYVGVSYGTKELYWQIDEADHWAVVRDRSYNGLGLDAGVLFKYRKLAVSAAVSSTTFGYFEGEIGLGFVF